MFKNKWWMGTKVVSDEGFSIEWGRDLLVYREDGRSMSVTVDYGANDINVFTDSVTRWDDNPSVLIDKTVQERIVSNIFRALTFYQERQHGKVRLIE
jgi:hypothetical protein